MTGPELAGNWTIATPAMSNSKEDHFRRPRVCPSIVTLKMAVVKIFN
jgi:hypothetical protein